MAQEALLRGWRHRGRCANPDDPLPWLAAIARNEALRRLQRPRETPLDHQAIVEREGGWSGELDNLPIRIDVGRALAELPDADRHLLDLRYVEDLTQEAVAERLSLPEGTVKVRLHRLRHRLRERLEP